MYRCFDQQYSELFISITASFFPKFMYVTYKIYFTESYSFFERFSGVFIRIKLNNIETKILGKTFFIRSILLKNYSVYTQTYTYDTHYAYLHYIFFQRWYTADKLMSFILNNSLNWNSAPYSFSEFLIMYNFYNRYWPNCELLSILPSSAPLKNFILTTVIKVWIFLRNLINKW